LKFVDKNSKVAVYTDFEDSFTERSVIDLPGIAPGTNYERFKLKAEAYLREHNDNFSLQKLRRGKELTSLDLAELERMLGAAGAEQEEITSATLAAGSLGLFIRSLVGLERFDVQEKFNQLLGRSNLSENQIRFIYLIIDELCRNGVMETRRLYESPFIDYSPAGPETIFEVDDTNLILRIVEEIKSSAEVSAA
jgi:type I restriction enzyme R subunit